MIPDYIREQVLNAKPPDGCCVPGGSVPAVAEGHFTFARAAAAEAALTCPPRTGPSTEIENLCRAG